MAEIDVTKSSLADNRFDKNILVDMLKNIPQKERAKLKTKLTDQMAQYNADTVNRGNQVLNFLKDEGYTYDVLARADGKGLMAKLRNLGGSDFLVTIASNDDPSRRNSNGASVVGNVVMDNRSFYTNTRNTTGLQNSFDMIKALTGKVKVKATENKSNKNNYDVAYDILDDNGRSISRFFRGRSRELPKDLQVETEEMELDDDFAEAFGAEQAANISPLQRLIEDTNFRIEQEANEDNLISIVNQGFREDIEVHPIEVEDYKTYNNLDLDMLLALNDRNTISDAIVEEMVRNEDFDLRNESITAEEGLKDLLMEATAGIRTNELESVEIDPNYQQVLDIVRENLEKQSIENVDVRFDEDHVVHWSGNIVDRDKSGNEISRSERSGMIGQIFLPDENGVINTNFKTIEENSDRNYKMVPSYTAYYADRSGFQYVPKTVHATIEGRTGDFVVRESGEVFYMPEARGQKPRPWTKEELTPERLSQFQESIRKFNNNKKSGKTYSPIAVTEQQKTRLEPMTTMYNNKEVVADVDGNPLIVNGKTFIKEQFPENVLRRQIASIQKRNAKNPDNPIPMIGTKEVTPSLRDAIRLRGFEQSLNQSIEAVVARQVLQNDSRLKDNNSLNKLYHGDVYGTRIKNDNLAYDSILETYKRRVRFPNEITNLTADELDEHTVLDSSGNPVETKKTATHRHNLKAFEGIFDRSLSSDGQALGKIRYLNDGVVVNEDGSLNVPDDNYKSTAPIFNDLDYYTWGDPSDRTMMGANQVIKSRNVAKSRVALMTYKGYTFEDGSVISEKFAKEQGAIVNGYDENGEPIPLEVGDKISDSHGNKSTISYIATPENDKLFEENPDLDVIMNPHSIVSRMNTGVVLEMQGEATEQEPLRDITYNGVKVAESGLLNVVVTDITAKDKTHTYEKGEGRLGRSFGVQEAWVANALNLDGVMDEIYGHNEKSFERLRQYLNVTGIDIDEDGVMYDSTGIKYDAETGEYNMPIVDLENYDKSQGLELPEGDSALKLPFKVELPSGKSTDLIKVLPEEYRKTQELYDGGRMYHDYSRVYSDLADLSSDFIEWRNEMDQKVEQDLSQIDFSKQSDFEAFLDNFTDEKERQEAKRYVETAQNRMQGKMSQLTDRVIDDKLGGRMTYDEDKDRSLKDTEAIKRSIMKRDIMGHQVPHSATSVVTANPNVDMNTLKVSPEIFEKMNLKDPENDRVLLWRDPALHDGSMRSFKIEKDESIVGVGINPLVTESFGMDFDGDTVGIYAPKSKEAQHDLRTKSALENHLIDPTSEKFTGNIGMDFVSSAYQAGYVGESITQGPLKGRENEIKDMNAKDQLHFMLTEMAQKEDGYEEINQLWKDTVTSEEYNIGASTIDLKDRESFKESMMRQARIGAKGKEAGVSSDVEQKFDSLEAQRGQKIPYSDKMRDKQFRSPNGNGNKPTVMQHYDRALYMKDLSDTIKNSKDETSKNIAGKQLKYMLTPGHYKKDNKTGMIEWKEHYGSLARDYNRTREAQAGKVDLTGRAGSKSQMLVSVMFDQPEGAMSAMEVTEPLTQATLKLKHNPDDTPKIEELLNDYDKMLKDGGLDREGFVDKFKGKDGMYTKVGLDVNDKHLNQVFDTLSDGNGKDAVTRPIDQVLNEKMSPLMKANMYGYDSIKEMSNNNTKNLSKIAKGYTDVSLESFKDGENSGKHVPKELNKVTSPSMEKAAEKCYSNAVEKIKAEKEQSELVKQQEPDMVEKEVEDKEIQQSEPELEPEKPIKSQSVKMDKQKDGFEMV